MIKAIFSKELKYILGFPITYISLSIFVGFFTFIYSRGQVFVGVLREGEFVNSPHAITATAIFLTIIAMMVALPIFYNAASREYQHGFEEILFSTPISKRQFFIGRLLAAFALMMIPALLLIGMNIGGVEIGLAIGSILPEETTAFRASTFLRVFVFIVLPNLLILGSVVFGLSIWFKKLGYAFVGLGVLLIGYLLGLYGFSQDISLFTLGALADPFGEFAYNLDIRYLTVEALNTQDLYLGPYLLKNRLLWISLALFFLGVSYRQFQLQHYGVGSKKKNTIIAPSTPVAIAKSFPKIHLQFSSFSLVQQFWSLCQLNFRWVAGRLPFRAFFAALGGMLLVDFFARQHDYGIAPFPLTYELIANARDYDALMMLLILYLTGELVWENRSHRIDEVVDATIHPSVLSLLAQFAATWGATLLGYTFLFLLMIGLQLSQGFTRIELWHYATELSLQIAPFLFTSTAVCLFIHLLVNHKFVAYAAALFLLIAQVYCFTHFDLESNMLRINGNGGHIFSDLNGYGPFLKGNLWFNAYWMLTACMLLVAALLFWVRGKDLRLVERWKNRRMNWSPEIGKISGVLFIIWLSTVGFVYYNTQILNAYSTSTNTNELKAQYERKYKKYAEAPLPQIVDARCFVDFYPEQRGLRSRSELWLKNNTTQSIDSLFFSTRDANRRPGWTNRIDIPGSQLVLNDSFSGFQIYTLSTPLFPGDSIQMQAFADYHTIGFENAVSNQHIVDNGSFINLAQLLPHVGYRPESEIRDQEIRSEKNLPAKVIIPPLETGICQHCTHNQLSAHHSWLNMEATLSTSADQTAVTAGSLLREWETDGRRFFHYRLDHPSLLFNSFISARYEIARRKWRGIDLEVYHDAKHAYNIETMLDEIENAMEYYTENFGPYFHRQVRIVEFPQYNNSAQAFPGTMPYSESRGFILDMPANGNNPIASTIGHEIGHQWWGHQIVPADMQGSSMLTESFAEYSSLMIMKKNQGPEGMINFLKYDYDDYLYRRSFAAQKEQPLYLVEEQSYIYYRKGSVVLYTLAELIGEERVNRSLQNFLEEYRYQPAPYPRSTDYLRHLEKEVPDSLKYLIKDLFWEITFFENAIEEATYQQMPDGRYRVEVVVSAKKIQLGEAQQEVEVAIEDWFEIGIRVDQSAEGFLLLEKVKLENAQQVFSFVVEELPQVVELDPRYLFFDRNRGDNWERVGER